MESTENQTMLTEIKEEKVEVKKNKHIFEKCLNCPLCPKKFKYDVHLNKHVKNFHGDATKRYKKVRLN